MYLQIKNSAEKAQVEIHAYTNRLQFVISTPSRDYT